MKILIWQHLEWIKLLQKYVIRSRKKRRPLHNLKQIFKSYSVYRYGIKRSVKLPLQQPNQCEKIWSITLSTKGISAVCKMTTVMKDAASTVFWVSIIYRRYQSAYSIINNIYRYSNVAKHSVIETIWRYVWKVSFILCCSGIVKKIKIHCERYLCLRKRTIDL